MLALSLRGLQARPLRTVLTALAVVLGVAMISGTFVLTDTLRRSFDNIFETAREGADVVITQREAVKLDFEDPPPFDERIVAQARVVDGVDAAAGGVFREGAIYGRDGKRLSTTTPSFVTSRIPEPFNPFSYVEGRAPRTAGEVALDRKTADDEGFKVGDTLRVSGSAAAKNYRIVGVARYGDVDSIAGAAVSILTLPEAQRTLGSVGKVDEVDVLADKGVSPGELVTRLRAELPTTLTVRTAADDAKAQSEKIADQFSFIKIALLVFAGISLFVGAFMIFNTFNITVAQRTREFALLRTLGASRRQVRRAVVLEALVVGVVASLVGVVAGIGLAPGLGALLAAFGIDLPRDGTVLARRTVIVALLVGTLVTLLASLIPAIRATRVPPVVALTEVTTAPRRHSRRRTLITVLVGLLGLGILVSGLAGGGSGESVATLLGLGSVLILVAVGLESARAVGPIAGVVGGALERVRGLTGRLARENATRNPGRTAGTAAALMVGVVFITFVTIFSAGLKGSIDDAVTESFNADVVVQSTSEFGQVGDDTRLALAGLPAVAATTPLKFTQAGGPGGKVNVSGVEPSGADLFRLDFKQGSSATLRGLTAHEAVVDVEWAKEQNIGVGGQMSLITPKATHIEVTVRGTFEDRLDFGGDIVLPANTLLTQFGTTRDQFILIKGAAGTSPDALKRDIDGVLNARYPDAEARTLDQFRDEQGRQVTQLLGLVYVLLSMAVLVSLLGIVNTLALSIHERTRELGLLRAVGATREQVRRIVRYEAVITALIGASIGTVLGLLFTLVISRPLVVDGFTLTIPFGQLLAILVASAIAGVVTAIGPARRAARIDVLEALAYE